MKKSLCLCAFVLSLITAFADCGRAEVKSAETAVSNTAMQVTDYSRNENWLMKRVIDTAKYDVIFIYGTAITEPTHRDGVGDICERMHIMGKANYTTIAAQLSDVISTAKNRYSANVFIPLYRQIALNYAIGTYKGHDEFINDLKSKSPYQDMKAALDYYFKNLNPGAKRPFVLSGHSQGGAMLQVVLEQYFIKGNHKDYLKNMIAAYSVGYGVSKKWFDGLDKNLNGEEVLHFAKGALDTNCLISWNTEGPGFDETATNILLPDEDNDTYIINPLNWKTDETPATRDENFGVLIPNPNKNENDPFAPTHIVSFDKKDKYNGQINLKRGSIVSTEHSGNYVNLPPFGAIWGGTSLHVNDGSAFYVNMARNLGDRLEAFLKK